MPFSLINTILVFLINTVGIWLAFWVYLANKGARINKIFSFTTLLALIWVDFCYLANTALTISQALFWTKLAEGTVMVLLVALYFLAVYFPRESKRPFILDKIVVFLGIVFIVLIFFTDLVTKGMARVGTWGFSPSPGKLWILFNGTALLITILVLYFLLKKYFELSKKERLKIQYFLIGAFIFVGMNIVFNIILPGYYRDYRLVQFGSNSAIFLLAFTAFAIVKRELFGIKTILTAIFVALITVLLALDALVFTPQFILKALKGGVLVIFLYFGYLLIKSVREEIKRREELERLSKAKSEFLSIASHQLRTPLTAIKGYISMILEEGYGKLPSKTQKPLEHVYKSNERLIKLVNDLLNVSRIESGRIEIKRELVSIKDLISEVIKELKIEAEKKDIYVKLKPPEEKIPKILCDSKKIRQVIMNILDNAIRYTDKGGVTIELKVKNSRLRIIISDTGEGMTKEELKSMFKSFSRGTAGSKFYTEGVGLGLYVSRRFVEMHNGRIWAESEGKGKGSTFYIELPIK